MPGARRRPGQTIGAATRSRGTGESAAESNGPDIQQFVACNDQLRRHLLDFGLQLHTVLDDLDRPETTHEHVRGIVMGLIDELEMLVRESALAMLTLASDGKATASQDAPTPAQARHTDAEEVPSH